jgi:integrase
MSAEPHSTASPPPGKTARVKPAKPYPAFPLYAHACGRWAKKIRGQVHYFAPWGDPDAALAMYLEQRDALHAGRKPRETSAGADLRELCNRFLNSKQALVDHGELSPRSWDDYKGTCDEVIAALGKRRLLDDVDPDDFAALRNRLAKRYGPVRLGNTIQRIRSLFKYGYESGLLDRPMRFGADFKRPAKKVVRIQRARQGLKLFTAGEVRRMVDAAGPPLRAMILLGINCGLGNSDVGNLPLGALDLDRGWVDYPRPKTGVARRCPLWPETTATLREALARRPEPEDPADAGLVFLTKRGLRWAKVTRDNPVTKEAAKLLRRLGINGRKGLGFYTLRHTFRTVADEAKDQPAADYIMGHEVASMSSVYRERISEDRLRAVADHVRGWLFGPVKCLHRDRRGGRPSAARPGVRPLRGAPPGRAARHHGAPRWETPGKTFAPPPI